MKRSQDHSLATSSSHRENTTTEKQKLKAKAVGCMSGLFHFVSSYNSRNNNKLLTFGKKTQEKKSEKSSGTTKTKTTGNSSSKKSKTNNTTSSQSPSLISGNQAPRSPSLPPEIRRSPHENRSRSALVARLMGLEEGPSPAPAPAEDSAAEMRRQLLGALEKCDRDLKALKKIIEGVRSDDDDRVCVGVDQQPSPVSVLDEYAATTDRSPFGARCSIRQSCGHGKMQQQFVRQLKKKPGEKDFFSPNIFDRITYQSLQRSDISHNNHVETMKHSQVLSLSSSMPSRSPLMTRNIKTMEETVEDVCRDIAWGQKREIGRIGLALQDHIFRDLVEEIVMDFGSFQVYGNVNSLPFEACKRRLCF